MDGSIDGVARVVMCFRLNNRVYAATCDRSNVRIVGVGNVGCDFDIAGGVRFDAVVDALIAVVLCFCFFGCFAMLLWFQKSVERGEIFFGGVGASVELRQIFDVLDFTYVGLHTSTDAKDIFLELHIHA